MGDDRRITDCEHYMRGNCRWGHECLFRHPTALHEPQVLCKFWQTYSCTNMYCQFLHPAVLPPTYATQPFKGKSHPAQGEQKSDKSSTVCAFYMSGRCSKPTCPFLHSLPDPISSRHPQQSSSSSTGHGQKRQAPDVLSKYSLRHSIEETAEAEANRKLEELDRSLENYQSAGALSTNKA